MAIKIGDISQTNGFTLAIKSKISVASRNKLLLKLSSLQLKSIKLVCNTSLDKYKIVLSDTSEYIDFYDLQTIRKHLTSYFLDCSSNKDFVTLLNKVFFNTFL